MCAPKITQLSAEQEQHLTRLRNEILDDIQQFRYCFNERNRVVQLLRIQVPPCHDTLARLGQTIAEYESNYEALMQEFEMLLRVVDSLLYGQFFINLE